MAKVERAVKTKPQRTRNKFLREKREQLRKQAQERQAAYDALTIEQKIAKLDAGGFKAEKQRAKLVAALAQKAQGPAPEASQITEEPVKKEKKGAKAARQARKDKKAKV